MSTKHVDTAADLVRYGCSLKVECTGCGAAKTMDGVEVVRRCGPADLHTIRGRLKCERCGMKAAQLVVLPPVYVRFGSKAHTEKTLLPLIWAAGS